MAISLGVATAVAASVAAAAATAGGVLGVVGAVEQRNQAKQNAQNAEDNARIQQAQLQYNARMEQREAAAIEAETAENARRQRLQSEQLKAQQMALLGKSGAAMTAGSPLAVLGQTAADEEKMIQDTHYAGYRSASAHRTKALDYSYGAAIANQNIHAARASRPSGASLALNIAGQVVNTTGKLAQIGGGYATSSAQLQASGMAGKPLFG